MPEQNSNINPEDSFTFVDKRHGAAEPEAAPEEAVVPPSVTLESADIEENTVEEDLDATPATYQIALYAVGLLQMNALQQLGLMADPKTGKSNRDLAQARVAIDCVAALVGAIDGPGSQLEPRLRQEIRRAVTDLRLNYVTQTQLAGTTGS